MTTDEKKLYFSFSLNHKHEHRCGAYPYEEVDTLLDIVKENNAKRVLELGTGIGFTAACLANISPSLHVDTIDQDHLHLSLAQEWWEKFQFSNITPFEGKAEDILPTLTSQYDVIFFDGYVPQVKFLLQFEKLLKKGGTLVTANLFLRDEEGGRYLRFLKDEKKWKTRVFADTAISVRIEE